MNAILCRILLSPSKESIICAVQARMLGAGYEWLAVVWFPQLLDVLTLKLSFFSGRVWALAHDGVSHKRGVMANAKSLYVHVESKHLNTVAD